MSQIVTVALAVTALVWLATPKWFPVRNEVITLTQMLPSPSEKAENPALGGLRETVKRAMPSVVNIYTTKAIPRRYGPLGNPDLDRWFGGGERATSLGSGVVVSKEGYVLTNNHVVEAADEIAVILADNQAVQAQVVGTDPETDLAVLKIAAGQLTPIMLGNSDRIEVGDTVLAIGNPFGLGQTVTRGIVSATKRNKLGINAFENFIQTDAAINPGNSGGALVDANGALIGINSAIFSKSGGSQGIGFAIPVSLAKQVMEQIITKGAVVRGWIGVEIQDMTPDVALMLNHPGVAGIIVTGVLRGGPADRGGLRPGDVIHGINGKRMVSGTELLAEVAAIAPGGVARFDAMRNGSSIAVTVHIHARPRK